MSNNNVNALTLEDMVTKEYGGKNLAQCKSYAQCLRKVLSPFAKLNKELSPILNNGNMESEAKLEKILEASNTCSEEVATAIASVTFEFE
jgi:hypothetical protein